MLIRIRAMMYKTSNANSMFVNSNLVISGKAWSSSVPHWTRQPQGLHSARCHFVPQGPPILSVGALCSRIRRGGQSNLTNRVHAPVLQALGLLGLRASPDHVSDVQVPEAVCAVRYGHDGQ
jgi:hypothetical protein